MSNLNFTDKTQLNIAILSHFRNRLLDKETSVLPIEGKTYVQRDPSDESLLGSIGPSPDPSYDGYQPPNSMGMVLLLTPHQSQEKSFIGLSISGQFDVVHRYIPDLNEMLSRHLKMEDGEPTLRQDIPYWYKRYTVKFEDLRIAISLPTQANEWVSTDEGHSVKSAIDALEVALSNNARVYRECQAPDSGVGSKFSVNWENGGPTTQDEFNDLVKRDIFLDGGKVLPYDAKLRVRARRAPPSITQLPESYLVEIFLENCTTTGLAKSHGWIRPYLLDVQFATTITAGESHLLPHKLSPEEYRYQPRNGVPGYGINTSVEKTGTGAFVTNAMPLHHQDRLDNPEPKEIGMSHKPDFAALESDPLPILNELLVALERYGNDWGDKITCMRDAGNTDDAEAAECDLAVFQSELSNARGGLELLAQHSHLMNCFQWMNGCMSRAIKHQGKSFKNWRLFQLGFILTQVRAVYERCCPDRELSPDHLDHAEVLWFATGGGKTEAYLGLLVMAMFYERMNERHYGPTGWMRFPLRMLSVQQFQRLSYVVAEANKVRQEGDLGGWPFTIGYFTGAGTPNRVTMPGDDFIAEISIEKLEKLKFIRDCPYCDEQDTIEVRKNIDDVRIRHVCTNPECWSNTQAETGKYGEGIRGEIGIYVSDEEVYRYLPTIMVGTVDKLANIGLNYRFRSFFGGASHFCPRHGFTIGGKCMHFDVIQGDDGTYQSEPCKNSTRPRPPAVNTHQVPALPRPGISFLIQDELHLMREALGNFDAHYESVLERIQVAFGGRKPKILAATATIKDYEHHINHLYQRKARRFPAPGYSLGESFYTKIVRDGNRGPMVRRTYAGILPLGQGQVVYRSTAKASRRYIQLIDELLVGLADPGKSANVAISLGFDPSVASDIEAHIAQNLSADMIYVNSNVGMSDVAGFLADANEDVFSVFGHSFLSGKSTLEEIQEAITHMETRGPLDEPRQLVANSVVSHGVDIEQLNFMIISKWTKSISEYMQVSARAGRRHPGVVLVILQASLAYENSVFSDFKDYHRFLDKMVESVPINRFSPNLLKRTLPGIVGAWLTVWATTQPWGKDAYKQGDKLVAALADPSNGAVVQLADKIMGTLATPSYDLPAFDQRVCDAFLQAARKDVYEILDRLSTLHSQYATSRLSDILAEIWISGPMRSLRDIEAQIDVLPHYMEYRELFDMLGG